MTDFLNNNQQTGIDDTVKPLVVPDVTVEKADPDIRNGYPGLLVNGVFWSFLEKISEPSILLRKVRDKINAIIHYFTVAFFLSTLVIGLIDLVIEYKSVSGIIEAVVEIQAQFGFICLALSLLSFEFLFFRVQDKKMQLKFLPKIIEKLQDVIVLKALNRTQKHVDIGSVLSPSAREALEDAYSLARRGNAQEVVALHIFVSTLSSSSVSMLFLRLGVSFDQMKDALRRRFTTLPTGENTGFGLTARTLVAKAMKNACEFKRANVGAIELFLVCYMEDEFIQELFYSLNIERQELENALMWIRINEQLVNRYQNFRKAASFKPTSGMNRAYTAIATPFLDAVSQDLTKYAVYGRLPMLVGRDSEINTILRAIEGGNKSVVLVGEPGVGKSAIISGIAERMVEERVPKILQDKRLINLSVPQIASAEGGSGAQERMLMAMQEIGRSGNIVTVIENIDQIVGYEGGVDLASVVSSELEKGYTFVIATTTPQAYTRIVEKSVLAQKLEKIVIGEPERNDAIQVIESKIGGIENKNKVVFTYEAVAALVDLSTRYMRDSLLPEKAIVLAQEVANAVSKKGEWAKVTKEDVAGIISEKTRIPVTEVSQEEGEKLLHLEDRMHDRIIGQEEAVKAVASALRRARVELRSTNRPIANFLFLGPTGVGKTELAKTTAEVYFGNENAMLRFDMSEYQDKVSVARLIGGVGESGLLTEAVRQKPFSLLLLDELEKAHPDILNLFLQVMDDGRLTDGAGRTIDFTNIILIATSNAGTQFIQDEVQKGTSLEIIKQTLMETELKSVYRPEFLNRFDGVMVFKPLSQEDVVAIAYLLIKKVQERLDAKGIAFESSDEAVHELARRGFDPKYGARPLRRVIQETVDNSIAEFLLQGKVGRRDTLILGLGGKITVEKANEL